LALQHPPARCPTIAFTFPSAAYAMESSSPATSTRAQALYQLGLTRLEHGDVREAYEDLKEASRLEPNNLEMWQKYEEAYSIVQQTLAKEHQRTAAMAPPPRATMREQPSWGAPPPRSAASRNPKAAPLDDLPPTFTFVKRSMGSVDMDEEAEDRSLQLQARMLRGGLLDSAPAAVQPGRMAELGYGSEVIPSHDPTEYDQPAAMGFNVESPKVLKGTIACWAVIWFSVMYYYQISSCQKDQEEIAIANSCQQISWPWVVFWTVFIIAISGATWSCAISCRVKHFNLSDGIKLSCGLIIAIAVLWHYWWQARDSATEPTHTE